MRLIFGSSIIYGIVLQRGLGSLSVGESIKGIKCTNGPYVFGIFVYDRKKRIPQ